ncbi:unnamed protein product [marine sediment metagenome]|uniref:Uncharacterized protein n=1 Tax=marine sediment metagenome TaxID=412755 RepID=X1U530_9ZZZZ
MTPDCKGDYLPHIMYGGKMSYRRKDGAYFIWWEGVVSWCLSDELGMAETGHWIGEHMDVEGDYDPTMGATGIATVTEI